VLGVIASVLAIGGVAIGVLRTLQPGDSARALPEGAQLIAFHQLANRICVENAQAMDRAFPAARSRSELFAFLARATNWGVRDLSSVTPPPSMAEAFADEIWNRRGVAADLLDLQRAFEIGDKAGQGRAKAKLATAEAKGDELNRSLGLAKCAPILPSLPA